MCLSVQGIARERTFNWATYAYPHSLFRVSHPAKKRKKGYGDENDTRMRESTEFVSQRIREREKNNVWITIVLICWLYKIDDVPTFIHNQQDTFP